MSDCPHTYQTRVIDRLGLMTEKPDGTVSAPVLAWHVECAAEDCDEVLMTGTQLYGQEELLKTKVVSEVSDTAIEDLKGWMTYADVPRPGVLGLIRDAAVGLLRFRER